MQSAAQPPSGHVFRVERKRGLAWYAKYRLPGATVADAAAERLRWAEHDRA